MPEMTGETANGRSMSVISSCLPRNWNLPIAHAAQTPKMRFAGTAMAAAVSVSVSAAIASGSLIAVDVRRPSEPECFREHGGERDGEKQEQKSERDGRQAATARRRLGEPLLRVARSAGLHVCHQCASFRLLQPCSALTVSSSVNEMSSMTSAMAVAPA